MQNVQILKGKEGIIQAYKRSLEAKEVCTMCLSDGYARVIGNYFDEEYVSEVFKRAIKMRELIPDLANNRAYAEKKDAKRHSVRFVPSERANESDMVLFDDTVCYISYNPADPFVIIITDPVLVSQAKFLFESVWMMGRE